MGMTLQLQLAEGLNCSPSIPRKRTSGATTHRLALPNPAGWREVALSTRRGGARPAVGRQFVSASSRAGRGAVASHRWAPTKGAVWPGRKEIQRMHRKRGDAGGIHAPTGPHTRTPYVRMLDREGLRFGCERGDGGDAQTQQRRRESAGGS
eukprot:356652-Chlamydomonas_euryale.AAC.7